MNRILQEDINLFSLPPELIDSLQGSTIIVTGATGLIGSTFVKCIATVVEDVRFILPVRNKEKAESMFRDVAGEIRIVESSLDKFFSSGISGCDYIIHCASPTDGRFMSDFPVETFMLSVESTKAMLDFCRDREVKGMVYLSSIEYYGQIFNDSPVTEDMTGYVDIRSPRSSYPMGKQAAEFLCNSYVSEYGVRVMSARLTQTFGAGISPDDKRVFAQFARNAINGQDIQLHTEGKSAKPYCYITDCVAALVFILLKGSSGEAYNVATPGTYISIRGLAELFCEAVNPDIKVEVKVDPDATYAPHTTVNLSPRKLLDLGWKPRFNLREMAVRLADYLREESKV
ncbi:MAG: NAD(P)-dependent oxidoreductase [Muribaculaceae bacterium]|nr:NAD(P)-dependent oxidoreductase [Muribaculaceae bacterium]